MINRMPIQLQAERLFDLPTLPSGWEIAATGIGPEFDVLVLGADAPFEARRAGRSSRYRVYKAAGKTFESFELVAPSRAAYMHIQPFSDQDFLLVTPWLDEDMKTNGDVWSPAGTLDRQLFLGEGISQVQTSGRSEVWVGYNDEGVFGMAAEPGVACFDAHGKRVFSFADLVASDADIPIIDDCYALNVASDDETWLYYYSKFPLVRLVEKRLAGIWPRAPGLGARAFAVGERSILFSGDYGARSSITRYFPESGRSEMGNVVADGLPLEVTRAAGRADHLYLLAQSAIWLVHAD